MRSATGIMTAMLLALAANLALADAGAEAVFNKHCEQCHGSGLERTGTLQLARTRGADKALLTERKDLNREYVQYVVRHGLKAMPSFTPANLSEQELSALSAWLAK